MKVPIIFTFLIRERCIYEKYNDSVCTLFHERFSMSYWDPYCLSLVLITSVKWPAAQELTMPSWLMKKLTLNNPMITKEECEVLSLSQEMIESWLWMHCKMRGLAVLRFWISSFARCILRNKLIIKTKSKLDITYSDNYNGNGMN